MNIELHIERLILDGVPIRDDQRGLLRSALETRLAQLLGTGDGRLGTPLRSGGAVRSLTADAIQFEPDAQPASLGEQIAGAVHGAISRE